MMLKIAVVGALMLSVLMGPTVQAAKSSSQGSCEVRCDQALSHCEHTLGPKGNCSRGLASCRSECPDSKREDKRSAKAKSKAACEQRCDLNRTVCEQANPQEPQHCAAGQQSCAKRCS